MKSIFRGCIAIITVVLLAIFLFEGNENGSVPAFPIADNALQHWSDGRFQLHYNSTNGIASIADEKNRREIVPNLQVYRICGDSLYIMGDDMYCLLNTSNATYQTYQSITNMPHEIRKQFETMTNEGESAPGVVFKPVVLF